MYFQKKVSLVIDLDDSDKYAGFRNYYSPKNQLTVANKKAHLCTNPEKSGNDTI
ncbi:MAG TPA: hypothetical protein VIK29_00675 [Paludibacter sp.]